MTNAGKYNHKIRIFETVVVTDSAGFQTEVKNQTVLTPMASIRTTRGMTLIRNGTDFERAYTNFTIRWPRSVEINRDMQIEYRGKTYTIEYLNNVNEECRELEIQAKEVTH